MPEQKKLTYAEAVNRALQHTLRDDPSTLVFGEDVAIPGGVFGVTKGLQKEFGDRVFDTPISESAILGGAIGAALVGRRPIVEIMWADFSLVALDQLVNQAANVRYVSQGRLTAPLTVRTQQGTGPGACAQHSQSLEAIFAHVPGLQVCMPTSQQDAYDLLRTAIASNDPTIVIENRNLYHGAKGEVTIHGPVQPIGGAITRRAGDDLTIVTWGSIQHETLAAADRLATSGVSAEIIDMRWLRPLDIDTVLDSVARTGRLMVVHEAHTIGGLGAEIVAAAVEAGVALKSRPVRIGMPEVRIPAAPVLLGAVRPDQDLITRKATAMMSAQLTAVG